MKLSLSLVCSRVPIFAVALAFCFMTPAKAQETGPTASVAPVTPDPLGVRDTLIVESKRLGQRNWMFTVSLFNDADIFGLSIPLKFRSGLAQVVVDSTVFTGGRVEKFKVKIVRPDTAIQCLTIGLIADVTPLAPTLAPGSGRLVTVYMHSPGEGQAPDLVVDTTTTAPSNSLLLVNTEADANQQIKIFPAFVYKSDAVGKDKKPAKSAGK